MAKPQCYCALKPQELVEIAIDWMGADYQVAMLTLSAIEGSAPYPVGTQMLVPVSYTHLTLPTKA